METSVRHETVSGVLGGPPSGPADDEELAYQVESSVLSDCHARAS